LGLVNTRKLYACLFPPKTSPVVGYFVWSVVRAGLLQTDTSCFNLQRVKIRSGCNAWVVRNQSFCAESAQS